MPHQVPLPWEHQSPSVPSSPVSQMRPPRLSEGQDQPRFPPGGGLWSKVLDASLCSHWPITKQFCPHNDPFTSALASTLRVSIKPQSSRGCQEVSRSPGNRSASGPALNQGLANGLSIHQSHAHLLGAQDVAICPTRDPAER